jgi:hypothetical protein
LVRPKLDPKREEYVMILAADSRGTKTRLLNIVRDYKGTIRLLTANPDSPDVAGVSGPIAELLTEAVVPR